MPAGKSFLAPRFRAVPGARPGVLARAAAEPHSWAVAARNPLDELAIRYGTDKSSLHHGYTEGYYDLLAPRRAEALQILEIGVHSGASLRMWEDFFPAARVHGIEKRAENIRYPPRSGKLFIGDQGDREFLERVARDTGPLDLVIDDGSHHPDDQRASLAALFPHVKDGGLYVIEDLACSFGSRYGPFAGRGNPGSMIEYLKELLDVIHADPAIGGVKGDAISSRIRSIRCDPQIAFLLKGDPVRGDPPGPDRRAPALDTLLGSLRSPAARLRAAWFRVRKDLLRQVRHLRPRR